MAETAKEIDFSTIEQEMDLQTDEVEAFIIDGELVRSINDKMYSLINRCVHSL